MDDIFDDEFLDMCRYEVGTIINNNRNTIIATNDLETATNYYESTIAKFSPVNDNNHTIVFLYDYDKNANLNYYDSRTEIC
nr:MAG TPA: hypothetical protein [Crassvirales sp.]